MTDDVETTAEEFRKIFKRKMFSLHLATVNALRNKITKNIRDTFGRRRAGNTARTSGSSGNLRNSVQVYKHSASLFMVTVGNKPGQGPVQYAAIHEYGGTIIPRSAQWLTIPIAEEAVNKFAGEFNDLHFIKKDENRAYLINSIGKLMYALRKSVTIPKRPYVQPAIDDVFNDASMQVIINKIWKVEE